MSDMPPTAALRAAVDELQAGRRAQAEEIVLDAVRETEAGFGRTSFEHAAALFDLGRFYAGVGDFRRAADAIRRAADLDLPGARGTKDRLTYLRTLGEMLQFAGDLDAAERGLREGLDRRRAFYGPEHSGYAFGLEALAEVVWRASKPREAMPLVREAVEILWKDRNPQALSALALRAFIHRAAGVPGGGFADLPRLADPDLDAIIENLLFRAEHLPDKAQCLPVLSDLRRWIGALRGERHASLIATVAKIADCARQVGDREGRLESLEQLVDICQANGEMNQAIKAMQALAVAQDEAGLPSEAEESYRKALAWARDYGDHARRSGVLRNFGLFLKEHERREEAEALLREAVAEGRTALDPEAQGRGLTALGILVQHGGCLDEARAILEEAIGILPPSHPDLLSARSHLDAIATVRSCGCGDMRGAVSETLGAMVLPSLPPDLLEDLWVEPGGGVQVRLSREPTPEERERLQRVLDHALRELRTNYHQSGYS